MPGPSGKDTWQTREALWGELTGPGGYVSSATRHRHLADPASGYGAGDSSLIRHLGTEPLCLLAVTPVDSGLHDACLPRCPAVHKGAVFLTSIPRWQIRTLVQESGLAHLTSCHLMPTQPPAGSSLRYECTCVERIQRLALPLREQDVADLSPRISTASGCDAMFQLASVRDRCRRRLQAVTEPTAARG